MIMSTPETIMTSISQPPVKVLAVLQYGEEDHESDRCSIVVRPDGMYHVSLSCADKLIDCLTTDDRDLAFNRFHTWAMAMHQAYAVEEKVALQS